MGRFVALIIAAIAAAAGYFAGQYVWEANEFSVVWTEGLQPHLETFEWRHLYAVAAGVVVWILALNVLWPRD